MRKKTEAQDATAKAAATVVDVSETAEGATVNDAAEGADASEAAEGAPKKKERTYIKKEDVINDEIYREFMAAPMREKQARALIRMYQMGDLIRQRIRFGEVERTLLLSKQSMFAHEVYINGEWKAVEPKAIWSWGTT